MPIIVHGGDPEKAWQQQREFYEQLGRAIGQWAHVEDGIYHTFRVVTDPNNWSAMAAAFHAIQLNAKLAMVAAAIKASPQHQDFSDEWIALHKNVRTQSSRRAKLAHWTVVQSADSAVSSGVQMFIQAPTYDFGHMDEDGSPATVTPTQVTQWANSFARLGIEIDEYWRRLQSPGTPA